MRPSEISAEAVYQLEELRQGIREDAAALTDLFEALRTPAKTVSGRNGVSMVTDVSSFNLFRESLAKFGGRDLVWQSSEGVEKELNSFFLELKRGVENRDPVIIDMAKLFCAELSDWFTSRDYLDVNQRHRSPEYRGEPSELVS